MKTKRKFLTLLLCLTLCLSFFSFSCGERNDNEVPLPTDYDNTDYDNAVEITDVITVSSEKLYNVAIDINGNWTDAEFTRKLVNHKDDIQLLLNNDEKIHDLKDALGNSEYVSLVNDAVNKYETFKDFVVNDYLTSTIAGYKQNVESKHLALDSAVLSLKLILTTEK